MRREQFAAQAAALASESCSELLMNGPRIDPQGKADVVQDQSQVDDLLAQLGFDLARISPDQWYMVVATLPNAGNPSRTPRRGVVRIARALRKVQRARAPENGVILLY